MAAVLWSSHHRSDRKAAAPRGSSLRLRPTTTRPRPWTPTTTLTMTTTTTSRPRPRTMTMTTTPHSTPGPMTTPRPTMTPRPTLTPRSTTPRPRPLTAPPRPPRRFLGACSGRVSTLKLKAKASSRSLRATRSRSQRARRPPGPGGSLLLASGKTVGICRATCQTPSSNPKTASRRRRGPARLGARRRGLRRGAREAATRRLVEKRTGLAWIDTARCRRSSRFWKTLPSARKRRPRPPPRIRCTSHLQSPTPE
mmetsp:Transcript_113/g.386  ORF Transcript_113/g.386 Transcript_113/m.386 type:complete len:253 (+) Transcript_113:845-1603(+)